MEVISICSQGNFKKKTNLGSTSTIWRLVSLAVGLALRQFFLKVPNIPKMKHTSLLQYVVKIDIFRVGSLQKVYPGSSEGLGPDTWILA